MEELGAASAVQRNRETCVPGATCRRCLFGSKESRELEAYRGSKEPCG